MARVAVRVRCSDAPCAYEEDADGACRMSEMRTLGDGLDCGLSERLCSLIHVSDLPADRQPATVLSSGTPGAH